MSVNFLNFFKILKRKLRHHVYILHFRSRNAPVGKRCFRHSVCARRQIVHFNALDTFLSLLHNKSTPFVTDTCVSSQQTKYRLPSLSDHIVCRSDRDKRRSCSVIDTQLARPCTCLELLWDGKVRVCDLVRELLYDYGKKGAHSNLWIFRTFPVCNLRSNSTQARLRLLRAFFSFPDLSKFFFLMPFCRKNKLRAPRKLPRQSIVLKLRTFGLHSDRQVLPACHAISRLLCPHSSVLDAYRFSLLLFRKLQLKHGQRIPLLDKVDHWLRLLYQLSISMDNNLNNASFS